MMVLCWMLLLPCFSQARGEILVDMSYDLAEDSSVWPTSFNFKKTVHQKEYTAKGYWYEAYNLQFPEHFSTHLDAPSHFAYGHLSVDQIPLSHLVAPAVVVDIQEQAAEDPNTVLTTEVLMAWLAEHGPLPDGVVVFLRTGWGIRHGSKKEYFGTDTDDPTRFSFPGFSEGAAQLLTSYEAASGRRVVGVGIDTPSLDPGNSTHFLAHQEFSKHDIYGLENVANLDKLPIVGAEVTILPLKVRGGSGGPCRILARIPDGSGANSALSAGLLTVIGSLFVTVIIRM